MRDLKKKGRRPGVFRFLTGYLLGFSGWAAGLHCLEIGKEGEAVLSYGKLARHSLKVFLWVLEILFVCQLLVMYCGWLFQATSAEKATALLVKSVLFLYIKVFWPAVFPKILPGLRLFFCPQCYQRQTFRFQPVSFQYGFGVTYLCRHCSCLVNGWGEQVFYPSRFPLKGLLPGLAKTVPAVLTATALGVGLFQTILKFI